MWYALGILLGITWYLIGISGFIYWWTHDDDVTFEVVPIMLFAGIVGPLSWWLGWIIHGDRDTNKPIVLIKKKGS